MAAAQPRQRVTERRQPLTFQLDATDEIGLWRQLGSSDGQLFSGFEAYPATTDATVVSSLQRLAQSMREALSDEGGAVVFTGSGTSGRLAMYCAGSLNQLSPRRGFHGLMAGGSGAFVRPRESAEDHAGVAREDLGGFLERAKPTRLVLVGITCGLSATYVGAQLLQAAAEQRRSGLPVTCCVMGFNPAGLASQVQIPSWKLSFAECMAQLRAGAAAGGAAFVEVLPVVGPESVAGSTRMKGGSATKMLAELAGMAAIAGRPSAILPALLQLQGAYTSCYAGALPGIAEAVAAASAALRTDGGRIIYVGDGNPGLLAVVDASECPPTFGASNNDVQSVWLGRSGVPAQAANLDGEEDAAAAAEAGGADCWQRFTHRGLWAGELRGSLRAGGADLVLATPSPHALEVMLATDMALASADGVAEEVEELLSMVAEAKSAGCQVGLIGAIDCTDEQVGLPVPVPAGSRAFAAGFDITALVHVRHAGLAAFGKELAEAQRRTGVLPGSELATKFLLNAITTGAHVGKGCVYENRMINLRITNHKLFLRASGLVSELASCPFEQARAAVIRSIWATDAPTTEQLGLPVPDHVAQASGQDGLVPLAIMLGLQPSLTVASARSTLAREPRVAAALQAAMAVARS